MQGKQHAQFGIPFGALVATILIVILGFGPQYLLIIPIAWFTSTLPDIDQVTTVPKRWRMLKFILLSLVMSVFIISVVCTCYLGYNIFIQKFEFEEYAKYFGASLGVLCFYIICFYFLQGKNGKFLTAHRGFTHILLIPVILWLLFIQLNSINNPAMEQYQIILIEVLKIITVGLFAGILGHQFLDLTCKAGLIWLWPIYRKKISIGNAVTSDPKHPRSAHPSSIITTYLWSAVCIILIIVICFVYRNNILQYIPKIK